MNKKKQIALAEKFQAAHQSEKLLILPNAWDAGSAVIFEKQGFEAIGTTSAGIAFSLGYPDGQCIELSDLLDCVKKINRRINVPLSVDLETGYGENMEQIQKSVEQMLDCGAVGLNLEDGIMGDTPSLFDIREQCNKIAALHQLKAKTGIPFVINARTDTFWLLKGDLKQRIKQTVERANEYRAAGADCIFVPGVMEKAVMKELLQEIDAPLNVLSTPICPKVSELEDLGVSRLSIGSAAIRASLGTTNRIAQELKNSGKYTSMFGNTLSYDEANQLFQL